MASPGGDGGEIIERQSFENNLSSIDSSCLLEDDDYQAMKKSFLMAGKGRRPALPQTFDTATCTNKILLQLRRLQMVGNKTYNDVTCWFERLFPDASCSPTRVKSLIQKAEREQKDLAADPPALDAWLKAHFSLHCICTELSKVGINYRNVFDDSMYVPSPSLILSNAVVIALDKFRIQQSLKSSFTEKWVKKLSEKFSGCITKTVQKPIKQYKLLSSKKGSQPEKLEGFLQDEFKEDALTVHQQKLTESMRPTDQDRTCVLNAEKLEKVSQKEKDLNEKLEAKIAHLEYALGGSNRTIKDQTMHIAALSKQIETKDATLSSLRERTKQLDAENKQLKEDHSELKRARVYKRLGRAQRYHQQNVNRLKTLEKSVNQKETQNKKLQQEKLKLQKACHKLKQKVRKLKANVEALQTQGKLSEAETTPKLHTRTGTGKSEFKEEVRKTMIQLQGDGNVAASKCSQVFAIVANQMFQQDLKHSDLPCKQSVLNMADEGHVLTKMQIGEAMLDAKNATLHTDGTTRDHNKIVGQQMALPCGATMSLGFVGVDKEDSSTLLECTVQMLNELTDLYCLKDQQTERETVFRSMLETVTSTMSDRASVMKSFNDKFAEFRKAKLGGDSELEIEQLDVHFLYCNAHYLLGLSRACEKALKQVEKTVSESGRLGRDADERFKQFKSSTESATSRLIRTACDVLGPRGDEKNGCRADWQGYCEEKGVQSKMTSFRSNRFNCFFEGAAAILHHKADISDFFGQGSVSHTNLKLQSVEADIADPVLLALLSVVALLYFKVTGPYWHLLQSGVPYTSFHRYVQKMNASINSWKDDPSSFLDAHSFGIFDGEFEVGDHQNLAGTLLSATAVKDHALLCVKEMMKEISIVTQRQLADFLPGGKYGKDWPEETAAFLSHCPLTNLVGENAFGDLDFDLTKRRHCSLHHHSTTHMLRKNRTSKWLNKKMKVESSDMMRIAKREAHPLRQKHKQQEKMVKMRVRERILENQRHHREKEIECAKKKQSIIQKVLNHGGPCQTADDVERLMSQAKTNTAALLLLKEEIRYQKHVLGLKNGNLRLTGSKEELSQSLKNHLGGTVAVVQTFQPDNEHALDSLQQSKGVKRKRGITDSSGSEEESSASSIFDRETESECENEPFLFTRQGQWVSVFYDNDFYVGQVLDVKNENKAVVKFMEKTKGRNDFFRWPACEDISEIDSKFVFCWDFDVHMHTTDGRIWSIPDVQRLEKRYSNL